jgi:hypothetical protein
MVEVGFRFGIEVEVWVEVDVDVEVGVGVGDMCIELGSDLPNSINTGKHSLFYSIGCSLF